MPDLMVRGLPPPLSPWALLPDDPQDNRSVALGLDHHILQELLDAFKALEPRIRLVEQNSSFPIPQALYPKFFEVPPLDEQVLATSNARGSVPAATVIDHCKVIEALYEAFMAAFHLKGASSSLGLICRQTVETSTLGNWTPLRSRLAPIPLKGGLLFNGEILQQADCLDKEEEQLKRRPPFNGMGARRDLRGVQFPSVDVSTV